MANQTLFLRTWDAGARTVAEFAGDGAFTFRVGSAAGIVAGLNTVNQGVGYTEIEHGLFIEAGQFASIIERGERKTERVAIQPGATFRIERVAGVVTYSIDGVAHYTSALASVGTVFLDCSLWQYGDAVIDATYVAVDRADGRVTLPALGAFGADTHDAIGWAALPAPIAVGEDVAALGMAVIPPLVARGSDVVGDHGRAILPALAAYGEAEPRGIIPDYAVGEVILPALAAYGYEIPVVAHGEAILPALAAFGTDSTDPIGRAVLPALQASGYANPTDYLLGMWPRWKAVPSAVQIHPGFPVIQVVASATPVPAVRMWLDFPHVRVSARVGWRIRSAFPPIAVQSTATTVRVWSIEAGFPPVLAQANGITGYVARIEADFPPVRTEARAGWAIHATFPPVLTQASGITGYVARIEADFPPIAVQATATTVRVWSIEAIFPPVLVRAGQLAGHLHPGFPVIAVYASARHEVMPEQSLGMTYAVNLRTQAVTTLEMPPLERLWTAQDGVYGLANGTLYRLDVAPIALPVEVRFAQQDFGDGRRKRSDKIYLRARSSGPIVLELVADEAQSYRYETRPTPQATLVAHRASTGKGATFYTAGLILRNRPGETFCIGSLEWLVIPLSRRI